MFITLRGQRGGLELDISMIRSKDGPTAIFLAGKLGSGCIVGIVIGVVVLVAAVSLGIYFSRKRKKKDEL